MSTFLGTFMLPGFFNQEWLHKMALPWIVTCNWKKKEKKIWILVLGSMEECKMVSTALKRLEFFFGNSPQTQKGKKI